MGRKRRLGPSLRTRKTPAGVAFAGTGGCCDFARIWRIWLVERTWMRRGGVWIRVPSLVHSTVSDSMTLVCVCSCMVAPPPHAHPIGCLGLMSTY